MYTQILGRSTPILGIVSDLRMIVPDFATTGDNALNPQ